MKTIKIITAILVMCFVLIVSTNAQQKGDAQTSPYDNASYLSQSTPGEMAPGQTYGVSVTMKNTGTSTWKQGSYSLKLMNSTDAAVKTWGVSSVDVNSTVSPGNEIVFNFTMIAPAEGSYNVQWQMAVGNAFFGEPSMTAPVRVAGPTPPVISDAINNNSQFVSQQVPGSMDAGQTYDVVVVMKNTGLVSWNPGESRLKISTKGGDNTENWAVSNVELASSVSSGSNVTFSFKVTAPQKSGTYNFQSQVMQKDKFFGEPSTNVIINVN